MLLRIAMSMHEVSTQNQMSQSTSICLDSVHVNDLRARIIKVDQGNIQADSKEAVALK